jgi:transposase-like protein
MEEKSVPKRRYTEEFKTEAARLARRSVSMRLPVGSAYR